MNPFFLTFLIILAVAVTSGAIWGGGPERWGAFVLAVQLLLQLFSQSLVAQQYDRFDPSALVFDGFATANFCALALYAKRMWPIWATSLQVLSLASHFAAAEDLAIEPMIYGLMKSGPTTIVCLLVFLGTLTHQHRLRSRGFDQDWVKWSAKV